MRKTYRRQRSPSEDCVVAALEMGARIRRPDDGTSPSGGETDAVDRAIAWIEAEASRISADDIGTANAVLAGQAVALDTLFTQLTREGVENNVLCHEPLHLALRAQSQCRATLTSLISLSPPSAARLARRTKNSRDQTIESGNSRA